MMRRYLFPLALLALATPLLAVPEGAQENVDKARAALARGDGIAAEAELERALSAGATKAEVTVDMGEALIQQGERQKARDWLASGQFAKGEEGRGWRLLGLLERLEGNLPAAGRALDKAIGAAPDDPLMWVEVGRLRYQGGEQRQALDAAEQALKVGPDNSRALEFQAQLLRDSAGHAAALPLFERALKVTPNDVALLAGYAASLGELGRASDMPARSSHLILRMRRRSTCKRHWLPAPGMSIWLEPCSIGSVSGWT
jgi:tetratricopeptide (TPR) repeat protein